MKNFNNYRFYVMLLVFTLIITSSKAQTRRIETKKQEILELPGSLSEEELKFLGSHNHIRHSVGAPMSDKRVSQVRCIANTPEHYLKLMDQAWTVMLFKQGIISTNDARIVLSGLEKVEQGGEPSLTKVLGGDEYHGSMPQLGRTLQEPMSRMAIREKLLDVIDVTHIFLNALQDAIELHSESIMPGMTHMAHSQPITYGAYLLALHDGIVDGLEHLELAYNQTNKNSAGCGATSGTGWPIDRYLVTELLGFDELLEPTYAGEAAQDFAMNTLFAASNIMLTISRTAMDHSIWGMDGYSTHLLPLGQRGQSSLMPQKAHSGSTWERMRMPVNNVIGAMMVGILGLAGEPFGDDLTSYQASHMTPTNGAIGALCEVEKEMISLTDIIKNIVVDKEKLLNLTRDGWGCTPDLSILLIRDKGYASRQAHRICGTMVRIARNHRKIKPYELTGEMLDEAARVSNDPEPHLTTEEIREIMDPVKFIERHNNIGDPNPKETIRMLEIRRKKLKELEQQQAVRRERVEKGYDKLKTEIESILRL